MSVTSLRAYAPPPPPAQRRLEERTLTQLQSSLPPDLWTHAALQKATMFSSNQRSTYERDLATMSQVGQLSHALGKLGFFADAARFVAAAREGRPYGKLEDPALAGTALILAASRAAATAPRSIGDAHSPWPGLDRRRVDATLQADVAGNLSVALKESVQLSADHWISASPQTQTTVPLARSGDGTYLGIVDLGPRSPFKSVEWGVRYDPKTGQANLSLKTLEGSSLSLRPAVKRQATVQLPVLEGIEP